MNKRPAGLLSAALAAAVITTVWAIPASGATVIAHYPLRSDGLDATGFNDPMTLTNAPFQDGGVYCNGLYGSIDMSNVISPLITALNFSSFAVSMDFEIAAYPGGSVPVRPILVCGYDYRWLGAQLLSDGTIQLIYNNAEIVTSAQTVTLGAWHTLTLTYDETVRTGSLYLDNLPVCSGVFDLIHGNDRNFMTANPGTGTAFEGLIREIVVFDAAYDPTPASRTTWGGLKGLFR